VLYPPSMTCTQIQMGGDLGDLLQVPNFTSPVLKFKDPEAAGITRPPDETPNGPTVVIGDPEGGRAR